MSDQEKKAQRVSVSARPRASTSDSSDAATTKAPSLRSPRAARFAEATAVNSPIDASQKSVNPFKDLPLTATNHYMAQPQPADVGFGYINKHDSVEMPDTDAGYYAPNTAKSGMRSPLKSAMKTPGAAPRELNAVFSPTFKNEDLLEKQEKQTEKEQERDIRIKTRVRLAKVLLRGINFSCSLIIVSMLAATFTIFNATKLIPPRTSLSPWAPQQKIWPQVVLLVIAGISLFASIIVIYAYWKGGHRRAEKAAVYYTTFACAFFVISIVMWGIGAGILQGSRNNSDGQDMWGWSCKDNTRKKLFENEVSYDLICRMQNWSLLCCIIEVVVETITIAIYAVVFYRFYSKRKLRQSMAKRDTARTDLYLAQLRNQSAPNTPGMPHTAREGGWQPPQTPNYYANATDIEAGHGGSPTQYVDASQIAAPQAFRLQPPPIKVQGATPRMEQTGFSPIQTTVRDRSLTPPDLDQRSPLIDEPPRETQQDHMFAAPGEQVYESVAIPGAYEAPVSPNAEGKPMHFPH